MFIADATQGATGADHLWEIALSVVSGLLAIVWSLQREEVKALKKDAIEMRKDFTAHQLKATEVFSSITALIATVGEVKGMVSQLAIEIRGDAEKFRERLEHKQDRPGPAGVFRACPAEDGPHAAHRPPG